MLACLYYKAMYMSALIASVLSQGCASPLVPVSRWTERRLWYIQLLSPSYPSSSMLIQQHSGGGKWQARCHSCFSNLFAKLSTEREKIWRLILLRRYRQLGRNVFWLTRIRHVLTFYCIWCRIIITESSVSDSIVNGVLIPLQYRTMWLHYTLCKLSFA